MEWVYHSEDIMPWANTFPFVKALITHSNVFLQPKVFRTSQQYTKAVDEMANDILKAKRLLLEQETDVMQQEVHHFKSMSLKRTEMASNLSLINYAQALLDDSPVLISDVTYPEMLKATVREIGSIRCSGHVPLYADDPPDRPENFSPREDGEGDDAFHKRVDAGSRVHNVYLQQFTAYSLRMKTRDMGIAKANALPKTGSGPPPMPNRFQM